MIFLEMFLALSCITNFVNSSHFCQTTVPFSHCNDSSLSKHKSRGTFEFRIVNNSKKELETKPKNPFTPKLKLALDLPMNHLSVFKPIPYNPQKSLLPSFPESFEKAILTNQTGVIHENKVVSRSDEQSTLSQRIYSVEDPSTTSHCTNEYVNSLNDFLCILRNIKSNLPISINLKRQYIDLIRESNRASQIIGNTMTVGDVIGYYEQEIIFDQNLLNQSQDLYGRILGLLGDQELPSILEESTDAPIANLDQQFETILKSKDFYQSQDSIISSNIKELEALIKKFEKI